MSAERRRLPRTGGGMMRVIAQHVEIEAVEAPERSGQWLREVAINEGAEGWVVLQGSGLQAWFEGPPPAVEAMVTWCEAQAATASAEMKVSAQRPCLKGGFELLDEVPSA